MYDDRPALIFSEGFRSASMAPGKALTFTRAEARTLALLARNAPRVTSREALLEAAGELGAERGDRSVDFVVNRLRRKLGDDARAPRYIATRYGEGYVWVGAAPVTADDVAGADIILGPVKGTELLGARSGQAEAFTAAFLQGLRRGITEGRRVAYRPAGDVTAGPPGDTVRYRIELVFLVEDGSLQCFLAVRNHATGRVLTMQRRTLEAEAAPVDTLEIALDIAQHMLDTSWLEMVSAPDLPGPLPVAMQAANLATHYDDGRLSGADGTRLLKNRLDQRERHSLGSWRRADARIVQLRKTQPDDPHLMILQAVHLHTKYILLGHKLFAAGVDERAQDAARIETLVSKALPGVSGEPQFALMGAKLLHFVTPSLGELVREIAEEAHGRSLDVAGTLPLIGQLRVFQGETEAGLVCLEQALRLTEEGSQAYLYTLVMKCQALVAAGDMARLAEPLEKLYAQSPLPPLFFEPFFGSMSRPTVRGRLAARVMRRPFLIGMLANQHYISARLFTQQTHRENAIRNVLDLVIRRFGAEAVPAEVRKAYPAVIAASLREVSA